MIKLPEVNLEQEYIDKLAAYQSKIDEKPTFVEKSAEAKKLFKSYNRVGNETFDQVKAKLAEMCSGARRCAYCEDSVGDEVEHIYPKDLYPGKCFQWDN